MQPWFKEKFGPILDRCMTKVSIVFFVGSHGKTRTIQIPKIGIQIAFVSLIGLTLLCLFEMSTLVMVLGDKNRIEAELADTKESLLQYQIRTDEIYEQAYPAITQIPDTPPPPPEEDHGDETAMSPDELEPIDRDFVPAEEVVALPPPPPPVPAPKAAPSIVAMPPPPPLPPSTPKTVAVAAAEAKNSLSIEGLRVTAQPQGLAINFVLSNKMSAQKARGFIWVQGQVGPNSQWVAAPTTVKVRPDGTVENFRAGDMYGVRFQRNSNFILHIPQGVDPASFTHVTIHVVDTKGDTLFEVPVEPPPAPKQDLALKKPLKRRGG